MSCTLSEDNSLKQCHGSVRDAQRRVQCRSTQASDKAAPLPTI